MEISGIRGRVAMGVLCTMLGVVGASGIYAGSECAGIVYAVEDNDFGGTSSSSSLGNSSSSGSSPVSGLLDNGSISSEDKAVGDALRGHRGFTSEQLNTASQVISPFTNLMGYLSGGIIAFIMVAIFVITALDLAYIAIPPVRGFLFTSNTDGTGAPTMGRGGYGGYGGGYGPGYGGGSQQRAKRRQWVSDEAVQCAAMIGGSARTENSGYGAPQNTQPMTTRNVISVYLVKRAFFMVVLMVSIIVLSSSILTGTGINLANWGLKIISAFNNFIAI